MLLLKPFKHAASVRLPELSRIKGGASAISSIISIGERKECSLAPWSRRSAQA
jgi:hypothetical protein